MKALREPFQNSWGINYIPHLTGEFRELIESAKDKIESYSKKEISGNVTYFKVKDEEVSSEFDCCDNEKCIKQAKSDIRKRYGKGTHVEECWCDNDVDHESIEICSQCGKPLNEWLTWCESELEYLEENKWTAEFLKDEAFLIHCILHSSPTHDYSISGYAKYQKGDILTKALESREQFFQRILELVRCIIETDF